MTEINKEIKKTFTEMDRLMWVLYGQFKDITNKLSEVIEEKKGTQSSSDSSSNDDLLVKISSMAEELLGLEKSIETRLDHLFNTLKPSLPDGEKLHYSFYELQEMLVKIVNGLPSLVNEKGEMDEKSLNLLTDFLAAVEKLEKGQEKRAAIPVGENSSYTLINLFEKERLENELKKEKFENDELRKELASLKAEKKNRKKQLKQQEEEEQQKRNEIKDELASIEHFASSPGGLSTEELNKFLTRLREMKNSLNNDTNTKEKILKKNINTKDDEFEKVKKIVGKLKLEEQRNSTKQVIADVLADKWVVSKKPIVMDKKELLKKEYRNYSETLDKINNSDEVIIFERRILQAIAKQRNEYRTIDECLSLGEKAIESKKLKQLVEAHEYLSIFRELQLEKRENFKDYDVLLKRRDEFHALKFELLALIEKQRRIEKECLEREKAQAAKKEQEKLTAQTVQPSK